MSDTRFTLIGVGFIFAGFMIFSIFGSQFFFVSIEAEEFGECFEYFEDKPPVQVDCGIKTQDKGIFLAGIIGILAVGVLFLIKGVRGRWDQDVKPQDMVGPGHDKHTEKDDSEKPS